MTRFSLLVAALAACGDNSFPAPDEPTSGTRLRLLAYAYEDGTRELDRTWFHDRERGETCTPRRWSDGVTYCTPAAVEAVYLDAACTQLVARVPADEVPPAYATRMYWLEDAWHPSRLFTLGERVVTPIEAFTARGDRCEPTEVTGATFHALATEIDRGELVRVTSPEVATTAALALTAYRSADGMHLPATLHDRALETRCVVEPGLGDTPVCAPVDATASSYFRDDACTIPALVVASDAPLPARMRHHDPRTSCTTYNMVGDVVASVPLFLRDDDRCAPVTTPGNVDVRAAGGWLTLPAVERERVPAGTRFDLIVARDGEVALREDTLYDRDLGTECRRTLVDGELRCVPVTTAEVLHMFADAQCTQPLDLALITTVCGPAPAFAIDERGGGLRAIREPYEGPIYRISTSEQCAEYVPTAFTATVGPLLPPTTFPAASEVSD